jgi:prevent-host-death family protein
MKEVAVYEAKTRLSELLAEVEKGEQFVITRRGEAIARLVSAAPAVAKRSQALAQRQRVANVFDDLKRLRAGPTLGMPLRQAIEQGRD